MHRYSFKTRYLFLYFGITIFILANSGCHSLWKNGVKPAPLPTEIKKVVFLGFMPALLQTEKSGVTQSPISGASFMATPVTQTVANALSDKLYYQMLDYGKYDLISANQAKGALFNTISSNQGMRDLEMFQKTGQTYSADAIMVGYIYRWQEREGTNFSASQPSSVAFELYVIRSSDKSILWKGSFDKTQRTLSENIFDIGTFIKGKGRWMTADDLSEMGLNEILGAPTADQEDQNQ